MNADEVDSALQELGNRVFNSGPLKKRIRRSMRGMRLVTKRSTFALSGPRGMDASEVRQKVGTLVKRQPQVMVRISGGGKGIRHIKAHLDYISRNGQIPLEDQNGDRLSGKEDIAALRDEWQLGGFAIHEDARSRQAFNIILSMPAGTSDVAVLRAAREFAAIEFHDFQYAMALHTQDTDPDKNPSPNPHVHLCVKATALNGTRLNPRKADLQLWRQAFAHRLRENGVECDATPRAQRLQRTRGEKQCVRHKKARGEALDQIGITPPDRKRVEKARRAEAQTLFMYRELARTLANSDSVEDRILALDLSAHVLNTVKTIGRDYDNVRDR